MDQVFAQGGVGINPTGDPPDSSAALDIDYPEKGLLVPRMTTTQRNNIASPELSLLIFNTTDSCFQAWSGSQWENIKCFGGCQASSSPTSATASPSSICPGNTTSLSVSGGSLGTGASWEWYTSSCGGAPAGTGSSITVSPQSDTMYYVRAESNCNITSCASTMVSVKTESTAPDSATASPATICPGSSSTLSVAGGALGTSASWKWYASNCGNNQVGTGSSISVSPNSTTIYYVRGEGDCNQTVCVSTSVTVSSTPNPSASSNSPVCEGNPINLSTGTYNNYSWSGPNGFSSTNQNPAIPNAMPVNGGTYTVTVSDGSSCSATASTNVTVATNPTASASSNSPVCEGDDINLNGSASGGSGSGYSYSWNGPNGFSSSNQNPTINNVTTSADGTYDLTVTDGNGCSATASTTVTVNSNPTASASNNSPICTGDAINLSSSASGGTGSSYSYSWSGPNSFSSTNQNPTINNATTSVDGTYVVTVTDDGNGCSATASTTVTVNSNPTASASSNSPVCEGDDINLSGSASGGSGSGYSYSWSGPNGFSSTNQNPTINGATSVNDGTYDLTVTDGNGCTGTASTNVSVNADPNPSANSNTPVCEGNTINLSTGSYDSYNWSGPNSFSSNNQNPSINNASTANAGTYNVTVTNASGCSDSASTSVTINTNSTAPGSASASPNPVPSGSSTTLSVSGGSLGTGASWTWYQGGCGSGSSLGTGSSITVSPSSQTTYYVRAEGTCNTTSCASVTVNVTNSLAQMCLGVGTSSNDDFIGSFEQSMIRTNNGNYLMVGRNSTFNANAILTKVDGQGSLIDSFSLTNNSASDASAVVQTDDDGFAIAGTWNQGGFLEPDTIFVLKLDQSLNVTWMKTIGGAANNDRVYDIIQTNDGGYAIAGETENYGPGSDFNAYVVKLDANGNLDWHNAVGASGGREVGRSIVQTNDNGFAVAGKTETLGPGGNANKDMFVFKLNNSGTLQWSKGVGGQNDYDEANDIIQSNDGNLVLVGRSNDIGVNGSLGNAYVVKLNQNGIIWNTAVGSATDSLEQANSVVQTSNGEFLVAGESASFGNDNSYDMYVFQLGNNGSSLSFTKTAGSTSGNDDGYVVTETPNGFAVAGQTVNFGPGSNNENFALVKFDNNNDACCTMSSGGSTFSGGSSTANGANEAGANSNIATTSQTAQTNSYGTIDLNCSQN